MTQRYGTADQLPIAGPFGFGPAGASTGAPFDAAGGVARVLEIPLPEVYPIPSAQEFNVSGQQATVAVEHGTAIPGAAQSVPQSCLVIIRSLSLYVANMVATTNITWTLVVNGAARPGYSGLTIFPRPAPFVGNSLDAFLRLQGPCDISVIFSNLDGGTYTVGAAFSGWYWPLAADDRWKSAGA